MDVVPVARDFFSCHLVDKPEEAEDGTNLYRPDIRVRLDRIWAGWFSDNLGRYLLLEFACLVHHTADNGNGYGVDRSYCKHEGRDYRRNFGSSVVIRLPLYTRIRPDIAFCIGFYFYDGYPGTFPEL